MRLDQPTRAAEGQSLARRFRVAFAWGTFGVISGRFLQFLTTLVLARMLLPEDFGALAVALVVQTIAVNITDLGATAAIARAGRDSTEIAPTVLTVSLATSVLLTGAASAAAPALSAAMGNPGATPVVQVMSLTILLAGMSGVPAAFVARDYRQGSKAAVESAGGIVALAVAVLLAFLGWGAMALAWSRVAGQAATTVGYWLVAPVKVRPGLRRDHARTVLGLGLPLAGANLVVFLALNADYAIVGSMLGPQALGYYLLAFTLAGLPSSLVTTAVRSVAVPSFGRLHTAGRLGEEARRILLLVCSAAMPIAALVTALAVPLIAVLYGPAWAPAATALAGLGVFSGGRIVAELLADICVGAGRTTSLFWIQVLWLGLLAPALWFAASHGGIGSVGWAHAVVLWICVLPVYALVGARAVGTRLSALSRAVALPLAAAVVTGLAAGLVAHAFAVPLAALMIGGAAGLLVAAVLLRSAVLSAWRSFRGSLDELDAARSQGGGRP
ncbi:oligosaccharide flippase family protein [Sinomonas sp. P47F7]|uniref:oligosaccharide flippase family protein n=1 Tax=Sinomonas sp. P47F7 TaxID=3410987 RepID=UPI003BF55158